MIAIITSKKRGPHLPDSDDEFDRSDQVFIFYF